MKHLLVCTLILLVFSCDKDDNPTFIDEYSDEIIKYEIDVSGDHIETYSKYSNDTFVERTTFFFRDSIVEEITSNAAGNTIRKNTYYLRGNSYASSSIDTIYKKNGMDVYNNQYTYENGFLVGKTFHLKQFGDRPDTLNYSINYKVEDGNTTQVEILPPDQGLACTDFYRFNDHLNMIDIRDFSNGITGKINQNLVQDISWYSDCHYAPSTSTPDSDYSYELNQEGYVIKREEIYTPGFHSTAEEVTRKVTTTLYEYNFK